MPENSKATRYIMVTPNYWPNIGGVEKHVKKVHDALGRLGYQGKIIVLTNRPPNDMGDAIWIEPRKILGIPLTTKVKMQLKLFFQLNESRNAVWHFHDYGTYLNFANIARTFSNNRIFLTFHGWEGHSPPDPKIVAKRQWCARQVQGNMAIGHYIEKWYKTKPDVISYGAVDVDIFSKIPNSVKDMPPRIAYIGRLEPDTGVKELVESMQVLKESYNLQIPLDIYGSGKYRDYILKFALDQGLAISVNPPQEDLVPILQNCSILFASGYLTILEALCAKRVVFAYYTNELRKDYLQTHPAAASMYICGNEQEVAQSLAEVLLNLNSACQKSKPGWSWAQKQSWEALATNYLKLWNLDKRH